MIDLLFRKKKENTKTEPVISVARELAVVHCCCALDPKVFQKFIGHTKLSMMHWYIALWEVTHDPNIDVTVLAGKLAVSYPTATKVKAKILEILAKTHTDI